MASRSKPDGTKIKPLRLIDTIAHNTIYWKGVPICMAKT